MLLVERSILKPVSLLELSVQVRFIWELEVVDAANPLGAVGRLSGVQISAAANVAELPAPL